ncbi:unnamed protein product [Symbiodinium natans]|nr:unnamed protein product [Symbiodinium natans]
MSGANPKVAPWETKSGIQGLRLAEPNELQLATGKDVENLSAARADQIHESVAGWAFVNMVTAKDLLTLRTTSPFALLLKGYVAEKLHACGLPQDRTSQVVISVHDPRLGRVEPRAITMANLSHDEMDFLCLKTDETAIHMPASDKLVVFAELRQADVDPGDWQKYGEVASFDTYVTTILAAIGALDHCILHRTAQKNGFLGKRLQIPNRCRNALYAKSGFFGVQFRAARRFTDPAEHGLEVIKVEAGKRLSDVAKNFEEAAGFLGTFASQGTVYLRAQDASLAEIRSVLFADDPRYNEANMMLKILHKFRVGGFTTGTTFGMVFSTLQSVGWIVVPIRIWHSNELATVIVGSDKPPPEPKFITTQGVILIEEADRFLNGSVKFKTSTRSATQEDTSRDMNMKSSQVTEDPWLQSDPWKQALSSSSSSTTPFATTSRVEMLEKQMATMHKQVQHLTEEQASTKSTLAEMQASNNSNFSSLLDAIKELRDLQTSSRASTPVKSPASKLPRKA